MNVYKKKQWNIVIKNMQIIALNPYQNNYSCRYHQVVGNQTKQSAGSFPIQVTLVSEFSHSPLYKIPYLIIVIFFTLTQFLENKIYTQKRVNFDKIHSKLPIFCVITAKYTVNCQFFALNL